MDGLLENVEVRGIVRVTGILFSSLEEDAKERSEKRVNITEKPIEVEEAMVV